jgi:hypothetical protein
MVGPASAWTHLIQLPKIFMEIIYNLKNVDDFTIKK